MYKMVMAKRAFKPRRQPRRVPRAPRLRRARPTVEFASAKQTIALAQDAMNQVFRLDNIALAQFDRMVNIAKCYQYFRMTKVELKFTPQMDTFTDSNVQSIPYLYYLITKGDNLDAGTFNKLRDAGAKAIRFDDKSINVNWRPAVLRGVIGEDTNAPVNPAFTAWAEAKTSPWLATSYLPAAQSIVWSPSAVPHKGILYGVEQDSSIDTKYYALTLTAHFQFKKPQTYSTTGVIDPGATVKQVIDKGDVVELPLKMLE
nr:coat protein [Lake Sarah-associated circular virus-20]